MIGNIKHIIVFESLTDDDGQIYTGEALYNDTIKRRIELSEKDFTHNFHKVSTKNDFVEFLKYYQANSPYMNGGIVFHFEMHGDEALNGLVLSSGELITWKEIVDLLRPINISTSNNLFITMGTCNGRSLYQGVDPYMKSPYSGYISASTTVRAEEIYERFGELFEKLIENGNIVNAYLEMQKSGSSFFYKDSETSFEEAFAETLKNLRENPDFKAEILNSAREETKKATGGDITEEEGEIIFLMALKDIYLKQKEAFDFSDSK
jgi:hypothetical protein